MVHFPDAWEWSKLGPGHYLVEGYEICKLSPRGWIVTNGEEIVAQAHSLTNALERIDTIIGT